MPDVTQTFCVHWNISLLKMDEVGSCFSSVLTYNFSEDGDFSDISSVHFKVGLPIELKEVVLPLGT